MRRTSNGGVGISRFRPVASLLPSWLLLLLLLGICPHSHHHHHPRTNSQPSWASNRAQRAEAQHQKWGKSQTERINPTSPAFGWAESGKSNGKMWQLILTPSPTYRGTEQNHSSVSHRRIRLCSAWVSLILANLTRRPVSWPDFI